MDRAVSTKSGIKELAEGLCADNPDCHQPETLHKRLIVGGVPVELHRIGLWHSHED